jgi:DnaJ-domain-containing protein 1
VFQRTKLLSIRSIVKETMGLFSRKSKKDKLYDKYNKLMEQSHKASTSNRKRADELYAEAEEVMKQIDAIKD